MNNLYYIHYENGKCYDGNAAYFASDFINISGCENLELYTALYNSANYAFYISNDETTFLSGGEVPTDYNGIANKYIINVPKNANYFRFSCYHTNTTGLDPINCYLKEYISNLKLLSSLSNTIETITSIIGKEVNNNLNFTLTQYLAVSAKTGESIVAQSQWYASNYIDISNYNSLKLKTAISNTLGIAYYEDNNENTFISGVMVADGYANKMYEYILIIPPRAKYLRFSCVLSSSTVLSMVYLKPILFKYTQISKNYTAINSIQEAPISSFPIYIKNNLSYKPIGCLSKGYILMTCDDGTAGLATYTIPMLLNKNVPCTFGLLPSSAILNNDDYLNTLISALQNNCVVAMHGSNSWSTYTEYSLNKYFDESEEFFNSKGISNIYGAICPGVSGYSDTNKLIQCIAGGRYNCLFSGGTNGEIFYTDNNLAGPRTNIYGINRKSAIRLTETLYKQCIDYTYDNNLIFTPFWHDYSIVDNLEYQSIIEGMIDYAKSKGLEFITTKELPYII